MAMSLSSAEVVRRVEELCRASSALSHEDVVDLYRLVVAFRQAVAPPANTGNHRGGRQWMGTESGNA
eukprot:4893018-Amphidinium_carterae.4